MDSTALGAEKALLLDAARLADVGFALRVAASADVAERGVVITSLHEVEPVGRGASRKPFFLTAPPQIPAGTLLRSPAGASVSRFANVVFLDGVPLDIPMREVAVSAPRRSAPLAAPSAWPLSAALTERVLVLLDERALLRMSATCVYFHALCTDAVLWMELFAKRFRYLPPFSPVVATSSGGHVSAGYWISRFAHQRREVCAFGALHLPLDATPLPEARMVRVVLLGPCNVGKSTLIRQLRSAESLVIPTQYEATTFVRTTSLYGFVGGARRLCGMKVWDIPGDPRNRSVSSVYCSTAHVVVCMYDGSRRESFEQLRDWLLDVRLHISKTQQVQLAVVAAKSDLVGDEALEREARAFARAERVPFHKMSAHAGAMDEWRLFFWKHVANALKIAFV